MLPVQDARYINRAIADLLITHPSEIDTYIEGHLIGIEAIRMHYDTKLSKTIKLTDKINVDALPNIHLLLRSRAYDGRCVDNLVKENASILSERIYLLRNILTMAGRENILSDDKTHTLPRYQECPDKHLDRTTFVPIFNIIADLKVKPRTRAQIAEYVPQEVIDKYTLDLVIQTLVEGKAL